jgi:alpha-aminoadipic semialdehyde synthase
MEFECLSSLARAGHTPPKSFLRYASCASALSLSGFVSWSFGQAGAELHSTLESAHIIVGIKETPLDELITSPTQDSHYGRTHIMFSHTAKGQDYNRPLLARFTNSTARLIDYELLTDEDGKRVVAFGWYAGAAGAVEGLTSLAHDHLILGVSSPFLVRETPI